MNYARLNREAKREALRNDIPFSWYQREGNVNHNSAIVEALAGRRQFSFIQQEKI